MAEPHVPLPPPGRDDYHDPTPPRCPECWSIVDIRPKTDEVLGWCPEHGEVAPVYHEDFSDLRNDEEEEQS